jgi:hypothetical protein
VLDSFAIPNLQSALPDGLDLSPGRLISVFQNESGKQSVFSADRTTGEVQLCTVNADGQWLVEKIDHEDMDGPFTLHADEQTWLIACWASLLGKPIFEVARKYLSAKQDRTLLVSLGIPADMHESIF